MYTHTVVNCIKNLIEKLCVEYIQFNSFKREQQRTHKKIQTVQSFRLRLLLFIRTIDLINEKSVVCDGDSCVALWKPCQQFFNEFEQ